MSPERPKSDGILAYGHDAVLLRTRCMVLRNAGFQVDAANSAEELESCIADAQAPYRLLLIWRTVPVTEQERIETLAAHSHTLVCRLTELVSPQHLIREVYAWLNGTTKLGSQE
jgi:hypothetical protein